MEIFSLGRLDFKEWGRHMTITTVFTLESGYFGQAKFSTFRGKNDSYMPTKGHVNLAEAEVGEYFVLKLKSKVGGSSFWEVDYRNYNIHLIMEAQPLNFTIH